MAASAESAGRRKRAFFTFLLVTVSSTLRPLPCSDAAAVTDQASPPQDPQRAQESSPGSASLCASHEATRLCDVCSAETHATVEDCCFRPSTYETCANLLEQLENEAKRAKLFLGKRSGLGLNSEDEMFDEGEGERERLAEGKRRSPFLGKRDGMVWDEERNLAEEKRRSPFLGKRGYREEAEKRAKSLFLGKRRSPFLG